MSSQPFQPSATTLSNEQASNPTRRTFTWLAAMAALVPNMVSAQLLVTPLINPLINPASDDVCTTPTPPDTTLYVWAGDRARIAPDFVAVVDFDETSSTYGKVLRTVPVPTANNEAHHMQLSADQKTLVAGGLLSLLKAQNDLFVFDVSNARQPRFVKSTSAPQSAVTDDFFPLPTGGFLGTNMGSKNGGAPGRVIELDAAMNVVAEWPSTPPTDGFNPHGISVRPEINLMVTSDFVLPSSTLNATPGAPVYRNTVRVWDFKARKIVRTVVIPGAVGTMDVKLIPGDPKGRAYTAGLVDGWLYLVDTQAGTAKPVYDTRSATFGRSKKQSPQILVPTPDGSRLILPLGEAGMVLMLNIENPEKPRLVDIVDLGLSAGPHNAHLTHDGKRLIVTDYFLDEDNFGKIHFDGDRQVHVIKVKKSRLERDFRFRLDCNTAFATGPARPHGVMAK